MYLYMCVYRDYICIYPGLLRLFFKQPWWNDCFLQNDDCFLHPVILCLRPLP